jgi:hypothetical protein
LTVAVSDCEAPAVNVTLAGATTTVVGVGVTGTAEVVAETVFERLPKTASTFSVPRKEISWKSYFVAGDRPRTVQVNVPDVAVPLTGTAHVPVVTLVALPQLSGDGAKRTSYFAGAPAPSDTWVNESVTEFGPVTVALRFVTAPGAGTVGAGTVILAVPVLPDDVAVIVAEPAVTPVTTPLAFTVATVVLFDDQVTA